MSLIEWSQDYSVGINSIDEQHKTLVGFINRLSEATAIGEAGDILADILAGLNEYTRMHFAYEEQLFAKYDYPQTESHIKEHQKMIKRVEQFFLDFQQDPSGAISLELMQFLTNWLLHHIKESDKEYAAYLISKGVK